MSKVERVDIRSRVASHLRNIDGELAAKLALQDLNGAPSPADALSEREFTVFIQLARGQSVNQIAETLRLSPNTVGTHLYNIKQKLGANNQAELALIAVRSGLIEAGSKPIHPLLAIPTFEGMTRRLPLRSIRLDHREIAGRAQQS